MHPLRSVCAKIHGYELVFDVAGVPYLEPAFSSISPYTDTGVKRDVVTVAYLLSRSDYARLVESEGGEASYRQIQVTGTTLDEKEESIVGWTLQTKNPRLTPSPMPSIRYIGLIRTGAEQNGFPSEYMDFLHSITPYQIGKRQLRLQTGRIVFLSLWMPVLLFAFGLRALKLGRLIDRLTSSIFATMWMSHDLVFSKIFGRGDLVPKQSAV